MKSARQRRHQRKTDFVEKVGRLNELCLKYPEMHVTVKHDWCDVDEMRWAIIVLNDTPYLACEEDAK